VQEVQVVLVVVVEEGEVQPLLQVVVVQVELVVVEK